MFKVLLTCPPMIKSLNLYKDFLKINNLEVEVPFFIQVMKKEKLMEIIGNYDAWIIGDDPATREVFEKGRKGKLKAVVKWGVGVDNIDVLSLEEFGIPFTNIPNVFGESVSDVGIGMLLCLNRQLHNIHQQVMEGNWFKPCGHSLVDKKVCLVGFGDIGRCSARKLLAFGCDVHVSDPGFVYNSENQIVCSYNPDIKINQTLQAVTLTSLEKAIQDCHIIFITSVLNKDTFHLINEKNIRLAKHGVKIINVSRGGIVCENDVIHLLEEGFIDSIGFDVFETEPLDFDNKLKQYPKNIFGTHNGSNEIDGVIKTSIITIEKLQEFLSR